MTSKDEEIAQLEGMLVDVGEIISVELETLAETQEEMQFPAPKLSLDWDVRGGIIWVEITAFGGKGLTFEGSAEEFFDSIEGMLALKEELNKVEETE